MCSLDPACVVGLISRFLGLRVCGSEGLRSAPSFVLYRDVLTDKDFASWSSRFNSFERVLFGINPTTRGLVEVRVCVYPCMDAYCACMHACIVCSSRSSGGSGSPSTVDGGIIARENKLQDIFV